MCACVCACVHACCNSISQVRAYLDIFKCCVLVFQMHCLTLPFAPAFPGQCMAWNGSVVSAAMPPKYQAQCWSELGSGPDLKETKDDHFGTSPLLV